jgi:molybdopterin-binding protein
VNAAVESLQHMPFLHRLIAQEAFVFATSPGESAMKIGARNQLIGEVMEVKRGALMGEVKLTIPADSPMASVMTLESIDDMKLKKGDKVRVVVKAVNVLLIKE